MEQCLVAQQQRVAFGFTADAEPAQGAEIAHRRQGRRMRFIEDGARQRVAGALLQRGGEAQRVRFRNTDGRNGHHLRFAFGQRAGFIEHQRVEGAGPLQRVRIPHQHAKFSRAADAGDNRHRGRQAKSAGTGDDQYGGGDHQGVNNLRRGAEEVPDRRAQQGNADDHRHKNGRDPVSKLANLRLAALRLAHHADNTRQRRVAADGAGGKQHAAVLYHRTGMDGVAVGFLLGDRLAGQHRFIQPGLALGYFSVNGHAVAGGQTQRHAGLNLRQRNAFFPLVRDHAGRRRGQIQ